MDKNTLGLALLMLFHTFSYSQVLEPVNWEVHPSKEEVQIGSTFDLVFTAKIDENWYLYANDFDPELGPMLTSFEFNISKAGNDKDTGYLLVGESKAIGAKRKHDPVWQGEISYFEEEAVFRQRIRVLRRDLFISGSYAYQVCSSENGKCIQGSGEFEFDDIEVALFDSESYEKEELPEIPETVGDAKGNQDDKNYENRNKDKETRQPEYESTKVNGKYRWDWTDEGHDEYSGLSNKLENQPQTDKFKVNKTDSAEGPTNVRATVNSGIPTQGFWQFAMLAFLAGLAALLTPCVFPMVPMTVTFFTHQNTGNRKAFPKALTYGLFIILIYTLAGTVVAWVNGPAFANWLSTHWLPNLFFFAVFVVFALSFLGMFEINLPSALVNQVDREADKGGWAGIFFMAFTLVLVSFSCTGPIVGALLVASAGGEVLMPVIGMASFALALALPFTLFAAFPQWMDKLPRSGGWLNSVKVVLGFLELALGLKFLSVADQVYHWGILDREIYLGLWIVIFSMIGFYLLGKIKLPHDDADTGKRVGVPRVILAICAFTFVLYLIPGLFGAPLKALAGYLPPMSTHDFNLFGLQTTTGNQTTSEGICEVPKYADKLHLPHGIEGYFDLDDAKYCALKQGKPLFIDFTGHGCVNCREMEARVWSDPKVLQMLKNDFVVVALYIDEKEELPVDDWYESTFDGRVKKTMGAQNADYQITHFNNNAQPFYVIMDPYTEQPLVEPKGYDLEVGNFVRFLEDGRAAYDRKKQTSYRSIQ